MAAGMSVLLVATLMPGTAAGRSPERFGRVDTGGLTPNLDALARNRDPNATVSVIVQLSGQPVAVAAGVALDAGRELTEAEKASLRQPLLSRQANLKTQLRTLGARVEGSYTDVLNGVRLTVKASQLQRVAALSGVIKVEPTPTHYRGNTNTVDFLRADKAWGRTGNTGEGVNVAIIDSGINYYHADFGGTGDPEYAADNGLSRADGNFPTDKVIAGHDFVGDAYDPSSPVPPSPDDDPLDCKDPESPNVQHGTHVAGTAAGFGVRNNGTTYTGSYDENTLSGVNFRIGPGTAPEASLMAYRVFGCDNGTNLVVDAIERATRDGADVINMSLGSSFGNPNSADSVAVNNASIAGVTVVMSAGNSGPSAYITGSPGVATRGISVAAMDAVPTFPSVVIDMPTGDDIVGINANGETADLPVTGELVVFEDVPGTPANESLGCEVSDFVANGVQPGDIAVTFRGVCARVARAQNGDAVGAAAVIMINNTTALPPFEGPINGVDIPFVGVSSEETARFQTDDGGTATISEGPELANEGFKHLAQFTSAGPRRVDSMIKPDVAAPGVGVFSADGGTTEGGKSLSGTSMASPAVAGVAALVLQANPSWNAREVKAALIGTASPGRLDPYDVRQGGSGVVNPTKALAANGLVFTQPGVSSLVYGTPQLPEDVAVPLAYRQSRVFVLQNKSSAARTYRLTNKFSTDTLGASVSISPSTVTVPGNRRAKVTVTIEFSREDAAALPDVAPGHGPDLAVDDFGQLHSPLTHVAGAILAKPTSSGNNIRVPWLVAPRGISQINDQPKSAFTETNDAFTSTVRVKNYGVHAGIADVYQWGILDDNDGLDGIDIRAAGVQSLPAEVCSGTPDAEDECLVFAINTWNKWNNASENEFDVIIDTDGDDQPDYFVVGLDIGLIFGVFQGVYGSFVFDENFALVSVYFATAPNNGGTMLLPTLASDLGLDSTNDELSYIVESFEVYDGADDQFQFDQATTSIDPTNGSVWAHYTAFDPVLSNGNFVPLEPKVAADIELRVNKDGYDPRLGHKGWMIVTLEDESGGDQDGRFQADLIPVGNVND
ncbi:MAG: S8 family serine peptidase [Chloroflexota bacterium]|nr:S8 family serine peptidase [Chloroflexota bacterium]